MVLDNEDNAVLGELPINHSTHATRAWACEKALEQCHARVPTNSTDFHHERGTLHAEKDKQRACRTKKKRKNQVHFPFLSFADHETESLQERRLSNANTTQSVDAKKIAPF
jgi:hypothetical protein